MIKPTIGRVVWFTPLLNENIMAKRSDQPFAAIVTHVWSDWSVNLTVFDHDGVPWPHTSVTLVQEGEPKPDGGRYCEWMPYQRGQAAKTEALEKKLSEG